MTEDAIAPPPKPPETGMERIAALEARLKVMETAMQHAFGTSWMRQVKEEVKSNDE